MKTIYLKVEMPDEHHIPFSVLIGNTNNGKAFFRDGGIKRAKFTEIHLPTEADVSLDADKYFTAIPKNHPKMGCDIAYLRGAMSIINKIKSQ